LALLVQQAWQGYQALEPAQACAIAPGFLLAALGLYVVAYFVQMAAWALIMRALQAPLLPHVVVEGYALSFLPRYLPGSVWGYLSRNEWLAQSQQVSYSTSTTASLVEAAMLIVTATWLGALYWAPTEWAFGLQGLPLAEVALVVTGIAASWLVWRMLPWLVNILRRKLPGQKVQRGGNLSLWAAVTFLYTGFWLLQGGALVAIAHALCGSLNPGLFAATAAFAVAWVIGFVILFVPAGMGVREWSLRMLLVAFAAYESGAAAQLALFSRAGLIVAEVIVLGVGLTWRLRRRMRDRQHPVAKGN
jgi:uncharacterized membrane protein YbhN (UPF0104 family)